MKKKQKRGTHSVNSIELFFFSFVDGNLAKILIAASQYYSFVASMHKLCVLNGGLLSSMLCTSTHNYSFVWQIEHSLRMYMRLQMREAFIIKGHRLLKQRTNGKKHFSNLRSCNTCHEEIAFFPVLVHKLCDEKNNRFIVIFVNHWCMNAFFQRAASKKVFFMFFELLICDSFERA